MSAATLDLRGHNSAAFGEDEPAKLSREAKLQFAREAELCAKLLAACAYMPKKDVIGKRTNAKGYILRCILEEYMIVRGCPKKFLARLIGVARYAPGDDERKAWAARDEPWIDQAVYGVQAFLGAGLEVAIDLPDLLMRWGEATKPKPSEVDKILPAPQTPPPQRKAPWNPASDPKPEDLKRKREAAHIVAEANYKRTDAYLSERIAASKKLILKGGRDDAKKEDRDNAKIGARDLERYMLEQKKLRRDWKKANAARAT